MFKKASSLFFLLLLFAVKSVVAQITIAPIMLFLDEQERFGTIMVMNGSSQVQEITIEFPFGYPVTDSNGNINMVYDDSATAERYSISNAVRGFPTNFTLQPGQRQVVRLTVRPRNYQDGMYWSRIRTTSTPQQPAIGETSEDAITTQITYRFEQVTTIFYKHGEVDTGLNILNFTTRQNADNIEFISDIRRTGNSPFLGSIRLVVTDSSGNLIEEKKSSTSIYFDYRQIFQIEKEKLPAGSYNAEITFRSERSDVPLSDLIQIEPISRSLNFTVR